MGFSKTDAYAPEQPPPERTFPDLISNQTLPRDTGSLVPPAMTARPAPPRAPPPRFHRRPSMWPSIFLLGAIACVVGALLAGWWGMSVQEPNGEGTLTYTFSLGSNLLVGCSGGSACASTPTGSVAYSSHGLSPVGGLYEGALVLVLLALAAAVGAAVVGLAGVLEYWTARGQHLATVLLAFVALVFVLAAILSVAGLQPGAFGQGGGGIASGGTPSPAESFWGGCSGGGLNNGACSTPSGSITASWGAGAGWYLALVAAVLLFLGLLFHLRLRPARGSAL
ncbi:MAG TPA: hypothetical protein VMG14_06610 [Thermoplasmata archaeon]|nr:hypothetical protein [Thermoplasmata archaeon]HTW77419.1 hypothetical protein [Thermoplasmata archaeon]